jgi:hypothetical protein
MQSSVVPGGELFTGIRLTKFGGIGADLIEIWKTPPFCQSALNRFTIQFDERMPRV